jgi:hypothetical protein
MSKEDFIAGMAKSAENTGQKNKISDLGTALNANNYKTSRGTDYSDSSRGLGKLLSETYKKNKVSDPKTADEIARNFVGKDGKNLWDK